MDNTCPYDYLLLPRDVFIQILMYQPVISLLRFKSVCKSWRDLIESSFFVHLHAATTNTLHSSSKFGTFIFHTIQLQSKTEDEFTLYKTEDEFLMLSSRPGSGGGDDDDNEEVFEMKSLGIPFPPQYKVSQKNHNDNILMVGSCNGLICLHNPSLKDVSLWNPATKQFRFLPKSLTLEEGIGDLLRDFVAFGFDIKTKDYKVVKINTTFSPYKCGDYGWEYIFRVQVYNLSTNCWRLLQGINYLPAKPQQVWPRNHGLYLNGCYIFEGMSRSGHYLILSFDFTKETFTTMEFPDQDAIRYGSNLCYLGGKIALFTKVASRGDHGYAYYDIWVLNEHGVKESWTKLHSIRSNPELPPIGMSNNGEFALLETKGDGHTWNSWTYKLELFNLVTKEAKGDFTNGAKVIKGDVYQESLVPIVGGGKGAQQSIGRLVVQCDFTP